MACLTHFFLTPAPAGHPDKMCDQVMPLFNLEMFCNVYEQPVHVAM